MNAVFQDAFLGRGTKSAYLAILNHISSLQSDENAPKAVSDEFMRLIGPDSTIRQLDEEISTFQAELRARCGKFGQAPIADQEKYKCKLNERSYKTEALDRVGNPYMQSIDRSV
jgi:hypothetical protein